MQLLATASYHFQLLSNCLPMAHNYSQLLTANHNCSQYFTTTHNCFQQLTAQANRLLGPIRYKHVKPAPTPTCFNQLQPTFQYPTSMTVCFLFDGVITSPTNWCECSCLSESVIPTYPGWWGIPLQRIFVSHNCFRWQCSHRSDQLSQGVSRPTPWKLRVNSCCWQFHRCVKGVCWVLASLGRLISLSLLDFNSTAPYYV